MNRLTPAKRTRVIAALVEGDSIRATVRMTGVSKNAIQRLLAALGPACERYQDRALRNLSCKRIQCGKWQPSGAPKLCTICSGRVIYRDILEMENASRSGEALCSARWRR